MRPIRLVFLLATLFSALLLAQTTSINNPLVSKSVITGLSEPDPAMQEKIAENYGKLPLSFEANHGQADGRVKFLSHTGGYTLFLTGDEAVLEMRGKNAKKNSPQGLEHGTSSRRNDPATEDIPGLCCG